MTPQGLRHLLAMPPREAARKPALSARSMERQGDAVLERLHLDLGREMPVRGLLYRPCDAEKPLPAILYCHAHGGRYGIGCEELSRGRPSLIGPYGPLLAELGFVVLCIDMPTFGERADQTEDALSKALAWNGETLMGVMLADLEAAFDYLTGRDDVDATRIAASGLSMGATHAYFLGALERRIARVAHFCCFADIAGLIRSGAHDLHGHYLTVPGFLRETSFGAIAGMVAPRPQLVCTGSLDPLTPPHAADRAFAEAMAAYEASGAADKLLRYVEPEGGHMETPRMREAFLRFLGEMV